MMFRKRRRRLKKVRVKGKGTHCRGHRRKIKPRRERMVMTETRLPNDVMELIFERLPTLSLLRFTTVCKRWRDCITARVMAPRNGAVPVTEEWVLMITDGLHLGKLSAYNPAREQWHSIRLPVDSNNRFPFAVAADGNVVCMSDRCYRKFGTYGRVAVCDPLLKQWHELPPLRSWGVIQGMAVEPTTRAVKILAANFLDSDDGAFKLTSAELYDTASDAPARWKMVLPPTALLAADCGSVFCGGRFVFLAPDYSLFAFDVRNESWVRVPTGPLPAPRRTLLQARWLLLLPFPHRQTDTTSWSIHSPLQSSASQRPGRVQKSDHISFSCAAFAITEVESDDPSNRNLVVWRLTPEMEWMEVAKAPPSVTSEFFNFVHNADGGEVDMLASDTTTNGEAMVEYGHGHESNGYSSLHHWTASGEAHTDVFRVWSVTVGKSSMFLKHTQLRQLLQVELTQDGNAQWRWVFCPHHVPRSARPFRFVL